MGRKSGASVLGGEVLLFFYCDLRVGAVEKCVESVKVRIPVPLRDDMADILP